MKKFKILSFVLILNLVIYYGAIISNANEDTMSPPEEIHEQYEDNTTIPSNIEDEHSDSAEENIITDSDNNTEPLLDDGKYGYNVDNSIDISSLLENFLNSNESIKRIGGTNRIETSLLISNFINVSAEKVILASSKDYADGLAAASITFGEYPVLLVDNSIDANIINEIIRLQAKEVIILGGKASISENIEQKLRSLPNLEKITRISGSDRYETAVNVSLKSTNSNLIFVSGENFPDALSSTILTTYNSDLLLTTKNKLSDSTINLLNNFNGDTISIVGGTNSISNDLFNFIKNTAKTNNIDRLSGSNRFGTSVVVAEKINTTDTIIVASGESFPDVLSASTLSQKIKSPILLVSKNIIDDSVINYIKNNNLSKAIILGGSNSISNNTINNIQRLLNGDDVINNYNPVDFKGYVVCNGEQLIYRSPDNTSKTVGSMKNKRIMEVLEQNEFWLKVNYDKVTGWIEKNKVSTYSVKSFGKIINKVPYISQLKPVYAPNGCEPTALLMGLKHKGYTNIGLREFLDKMPRHSSNPAKGYVGSPYVSLTDGVFQTIDPEPLAKYGQKYGNVVNTHGATVDDIIREIQNGNTVVIYVTLFWKNPVYRSYMIEGQKSTRFWNNHAVLVTGYNPDNSSFYIADPYNHEQAGASRDKEFYYWKDGKTLERIYNLRRFSITIR